jgi:hypothetical protein
MEPQMQRPVMNPMFMSEADSAVRRPRTPRFAWLWKLVKKLFRVMFYEVISIRRSRLKIEDGTLLNRFIRGFTYRLAFVPVVLVLFVMALVFAVTHPRQSAIPEGDPMVDGIYFEPVSLVSSDGVKLEGWIAPSIDARQVLEEKERALRQKHPAVVLAHDFVGTRQQLLPLVQPLHDKGIVVMLVGLRGVGSGQSVGQTFGLDEAQDIRAAVEMLRRRNYVDPRRVSIFGMGTGANAALLTAEQDKAIASLVLSGPANGFESAFAARIGKDHAWLELLLPMCKWTFQVMYHVDADGLNMARFNKMLANRPVLMFDPLKPGEPLPAHQVQAVADFLYARTAAAPDATAAAQ